MSNSQRNLSYKPRLVYLAVNISKSNISLRKLLRTSARQRGEGGGESVDMRKQFPRLSKRVDQSTLYIQLLLSWPQRGLNPLATCAGFTKFKFWIRHNLLLIKNSAVCFPHTSLFLIERKLLSFSNFLELFTHTWIVTRKTFTIWTTSFQGFRRLARNFWNGFM